MKGLTIQSRLQSISQFLWRGIEKICMNFHARIVRGKLFFSRLRFRWNCILPSSFRALIPSRKVRVFLCAFEAQYIRPTRWRSVTPPSFNTMTLFPPFQRRVLARGQGGRWTRNIPAVASLSARSLCHLPSLSGLAPRGKRPDGAPGPQTLVAAPCYHADGPSRAAQVRSRSYAYHEATRKRPLSAARRRVVPTARDAIDTTPQIVGKHNRPGIHYGNAEMM